MYKKSIVFGFLFMALLFTGCSGQTDLQTTVTPEGSFTEQKEEKTDALLTVYFFWGEGCPHCEDEKPFLQKMEEKYPEVGIQSLEVWKNAKNRKLMQSFGKKLDATVNGVPFTVIGEEYTVGWMDEKNTGGQIEDAINACLDTVKLCRDIGQEIENE